MEDIEDWPALARGQAMRIAMLERDLDEARAVARAFHELLGGRSWEDLQRRPAVEVYPWLKEAR